MVESGRNQSNKNQGRNKIVTFRFRKIGKKPRGKQQGGKKQSVETGRSDKRKTTQACTPWPQSNSLIALSS